jgi:hypothetical protein
MEGKLLKEALKGIHKIMMEKAKSISGYVRFNERRTKRLINWLLPDQLVELLTPYPTLVVPVGWDGSMSHAVTVVDDLIFDSTQTHAFKLTRQSIDWICGDCGCRELAVAVRFQHPFKKKFGKFFNKDISLNWSTKEK